LSEDLNTKVSIITSRGISTDIPGVDVYSIVDEWNYKHIKVICRKIDDLAPDRVLLQYVPYLYSPLGMPFFFCGLMWHLRKYKQAVFFHEVAIRLSLHVKRMIVAISQRIIAHVLCLLCDDIIVSNECVQKFLGKNRTHLIHIGSNIPTYSSTQEILLAKRREIAEECSVLFAMFGNVRHNHLLLRYLKSLKNVSWRLIMIGSYDNAKSMVFRDELERLGLISQVHITGYVAAEEAAMYLAMSDVLLLWESLPEGVFLHSGALCAAMANSLVVFGSRGYLTDSCLRNEHNMILLERLCKQSFHYYVQKLHEDNDFHSHLKINAYEFFEQYLSWEVVAKKHLQLFSIIDK